MTTLSGDQRLWQSNDLLPSVFSYSLPMSAFAISKNIRKIAQRALWDHAPTARRFASGIYRNPSLRATCLPSDASLNQWNEIVWKMSAWFDQTNLKKNLLMIEDYANQSIQKLQTLLLNYDPDFSYLPFDLQIEYLKHEMKTRPMPLLQAIMETLTESDHAIIEASISGDSEEMKELRGHAIFAAIAFRRLKILAKLLKNGPVHTKDRELIISSAFESGQTHLLKTLQKLDFFSSPEQDRFNPHYSDSSISHEPLLKNSFSLQLCALIWFFALLCIAQPLLHSK